MKIKELFLGWLALMLTFLCACSDDKLPVDTGGDDGPTLTGDRAYITVRINDVNKATTRAEESETNKDYEEGQSFERKIHHADFYFFDDQGKYMTTGQMVNNPSEENPSTSTGSTDNVEWKAQVVVALNSLGNGEAVNYPKYLLTTLNYSLGDPLTGLSLADMAKKITSRLRSGTDGAIDENTPDTYFELKNTTKDTNSSNDESHYFVMTTSSYDRTNDEESSTTNEDGTTTSTKYTNFVGMDNTNPAYFITPLKKENFVKDGTATTNDNSKNIVDVYVERLSAKVSIKLGESITKAQNNNSDIKYPTTANNNETQSQVYYLTNESTKQRVYFILNGYKLNGTAKKEFLFKNCDFKKNDSDTNAGWTTYNASNTVGDSDIPGFEWNKWSDHRCLWAVSPHHKNGTYPETYGRNESGSYSSATATTGTRADEDTNAAKWTLNYTNLQNPTSIETASYCMENVMDATSIQKGVSAATSVLLKGKILGFSTSTDGKTYTVPDLKPTTVYRYARTLYSEEDFLKMALQYLNNNGYLNAWVLESGASIDTNGKLSGTVKQIDHTYIQVSTTSSTDGYVNIEKKSNSNNDSGSTEAKVYKVELNSDGTQKFTEMQESDWSAMLAHFNSTSYAIGYKNGEMYWNIPIKHLRDYNGTVPDWTNKTSIKEGHYGVVRNHWYQITINKIENLGKGIYNPAEIIVPNTEDQQLYELGARINILSWKVVSQGVDL